MPVGGWQSIISIPSYFSALDIYSVHVAVSDLDKYALSAALTSKSMRAKSNSGSFVPAFLNLKVKSTIARPRFLYLIKPGRLQYVDFTVSVATATYPVLPFVPVA